MILTYFLSKMKDVTVTKKNWILSVVDLLTFRQLNENSLIWFLINFSKILFCISQLQTYEQQ